MSTSIAVEIYEVKGKHGVFDYEREKDQPFVVSVWVTLKNPACDDDLTTSVDYGFLQQTVHDIVTGGESVKMMETLCDIMIETVSSHLNIAGVKIRIEKPEAPMPHEGGLAVVERTWPEGSTF